MLWAVKWRQRNRLDGYREHFMNDDCCMPLLFPTRRQARAWVREKFGYLATRDDLRKEPHGWRMPKAVRVRVELLEID